MRPTSVPRRRRLRGFTLVEVMVSLGMFGFVIAGILSSYVFLGRSLTQMNNRQRLEAESRRLLLTMIEDTRMAERVVSLSSTDFTVRVVTSTGTTDVTYSYNTGAKTVSRTAASVTRVLLNNVQNYSFTFYKNTGATTTTPQDVKQLQFNYSAATGTVENGTRASFSTTSSRMLLRNKSFLDLSH